MADQFMTDGSPNAAGSRSRPRSFDITEEADRMLRHFKEELGVNKRIQVERMLKFVAERGRLNHDQFFSLVIHPHFTEHEARQMIQLLAGEFDLRVDIGPRETHA